MIQLYQNGAAFYAPVSIVRLWKHIADNCTTDNIGQLRLDTLQLLKYFCDNKPLKSTNILYLSKVQAMLAKKAQEMLTYDLSSHPSMKSVSDIAKACGYVNQGRFASVFREFYGMKPLDYRRNATGLTD